MYRFAAAFALVMIVAPAAEAQTRQIRGVLRFDEYSANGSTFVRSQPVRWVMVTIKRGSTTLGTAHTGHDGYFSRWISTAELPAGETLSIELKASNYAAHVYLDLDWFNDEIEWHAERVITTGSGAIDFSSWVRKEDFSVHLSILDSLTYGRQYADLRRHDTDDITQVDAEYPENSDHTYYSPTWGEIVVQGPAAYGYGGSSVDNGWRDFALLHEYGHHLEFDISDVDGSGAHRACSDPGHNYSFAWMEGFASYYGWAVGSSYPSGLQGAPGEETPREECPPESENVTRWSLWDLHDPANESHDLIDGARVAGGKDLRRIIFEIFDNEQENDYQLGSYWVQVPTTILTFHDAWIARNLYGGSHAEIDKLLFAFGVAPHAMADLRPTGVSTPVTSVNAGQSLSLTAWVNWTGFFYVDEPLRAHIFLWSFGGIYPLSDVAIWPWTFNASVSFTATVGIPTTVPAGTHFLFVEADPTNRVTESNESNNTSFTVVEVLPALPPPIVF